MPVELSFLIPFTAVLAGILAVFFWAFSNRNKALAADSQQQEADAAAAAAAPARGRVKWSAAAAANAEQGQEGDADGAARAPLTKKQQIKMARADEVFKRPPTPSSFHPSLTFPSHAA